MSLIDWIKLGLIVPTFFVGGPVLGVLLRDKEALQRWVFGLMCFMTINGFLGPGNWGLTLASEEFYRGHAKGYHFYFNHILAIALATACFLESRGNFQWFPPGGLVYALFVFLCTLSIINAPRLDYGVMAAHKMAFFYVIFLAAFNWMKTSEDLQFFLRVMAVTMGWQALLVLKMKYLDGIYQVRGTFEHQNSLAMYAVLIGMPFLAVAAGPKFKGRGLAIAGFLSCGIIVQAALSRAALLMFAAGTLGVLLAGICERPTKRRWCVTTGLAMLGVIGLLFTADTIVARFHDKGNQASRELREVLNEAARRMEGDHVLGVGWNNYALCVNEPYPYAEVIYDWVRGRGMKVDKDKPNAPVESHYYLLLGENGYPGLVGWLLVIGLALYRNVRAFFLFRHGFERCLCLGVFVGCALNYVQSTLERALTQPRNLMLWLILYAVTARLISLARRQRANQDLPASEAQDVSEKDEPVLVSRSLSVLKFRRRMIPNGGKNEIPNGGNKELDANVGAKWPVPRWARLESTENAPSRSE